MNLFCLFQSLIKNQDHLWYFLSCIGSVGTLWIAYKAYSTWKLQKDYDLVIWKKQKQHDLIIENLSMAHICQNYIARLRSPYGYSGELKKEFVDMLDKTAHNYQEKKNYFGFVSIRKDNEKILKKIFKLYELNWSAFGSDDVFTMFFKRIIDIDKTVDFAAFELKLAAENMEDDLEEYKEVKIRTRSILYSKGSGDGITKEIEESIKKLETHRTRI